MRDRQAFLKYYNQETGEWTPELEAYQEAIVAAGSGDFDCHQVATAWDAGLTPAEAAKEFLRDYADNQGYPVCDPLDHDYSMNA